MTTQQAPAAGQVAPVAPFDSWPDTPPALSGPPIKYEELGSGALVLYAGRRVITTKESAKFTHQHFVAGAGSGRSFALWGAAELNTKLQGVKPATIVFLRYDGKTAHPTEAGKELHRFTVKLPPRNVDVAALRAKMGEQEAALDRFIREAETRDRDRRNAARSGQADGAPPVEFAPPHQEEDDDLPF